MWLQWWVRYCIISNIRAYPRNPQKHRVHNRNYMCTYTGVLSKGKIFAMLQCREKSINATCKCSLTRSRQYQIPEHVFKKSIITHPIVYIIQISYCVAINSAHCVWKRSIAATWSMKLVDHKPLQNNFLRQSTLKKKARGNVHMLDNQLSH